MHILGGLLFFYGLYCVVVVAAVWLLSCLPTLIAILFSLCAAALDRVLEANFCLVLPALYRTTRAACAGQSPTMPKLKPGVFRDPVGTARAQWEQESARMTEQLFEMALRVLGLRSGFTRGEFVAAYKAALADAQRRGSAADQEAINKAREVILAAHDFREGA